MGFGNMTIGGPQIIGGGGDISMNDTIGGIVNVMSSQKKLSTN